MSSSINSARFPTGGIRTARGTLRPWKWQPPDARRTQLIRCAAEQWYLLRAAPSTRAGEPSTVQVRFLSANEALFEQCVRLNAIPSRNGAQPHCGWVQSPARATHMQVELSNGHSARPLAELVLSETAERDPKCHPGANVPRWTAYQPPFPLDRLVLPESLRALADFAPQNDIAVMSRPRSLRQLAARAMGAAVVLDPDWIGPLRLTSPALDQLASIAYVLIDLDSLTRILNRAGQRGLECRTSAAADRIMSARVIYADLATRGFALEDAFPYAALDDRDRHTTRAITMNRAWKRYADAHDFAPLLASETPWITRSGDILAAVRAIGKGELLATDAPWLAAGRLGQPVAPRLAKHLVQMQLGAPLPDHIQYWNRWDETQIVVRDLLELSRRYPPLRAHRWSTLDAAAAALGLTLPPLDGPADRHLLVHTGRVDNLDSHGGLAPEPLAIFMRWLAREARERTPWARQNLRATAVTLQFDTRAGLRYAHTYEAAPRPGSLGRELHVTLRVLNAVAPIAAAALARPGEISILDDLGVFGDGAHDFQDRLCRTLRAAIEAASRGRTAVDPK